MSITTEELQGSADQWPLVIRPHHLDAMQPWVAAEFTHGDDIGLAGWAEMYRGWYPEVASVLTNEEVSNAAELIDDFHRSHPSREVLVTTENSRILMDTYQAGLNGTRRTLPTGASLIKGFVDEARAPGVALRSDEETYLHTTVGGVKLVLTNRYLTVQAAKAIAS